ncbi:hypothetical protein [Nocardia spumae]|uniref:hypothetical protein n=1 Tax=Nocardia spumae TaxID=2887190 RepID=UPI001D133F92|nr:hypothetical protein [Nocardia spumae]
MRFANRMGRISGTAYNEALLLDPDLAEATKDIPRATHPQLFGFSSLHHLITDLADITLQAAVARGGGDVESARLKRPLTAAVQLDLQQRQTNMRKLFIDWFPDHMDKVPKLKPRQ